jgi:HAD superfamily hydrolase (TIGR01459 family)
VFHLGPERDRPVLEGLRFEVTDTPADADFVLNTGPDDHRNPSDMAEFEAVLVECARYRLKMICGNPDLEVIRGGVRVLCAGALAARYRELGGDVRSLGKPDPAIYQPVLEQLGLPPGEVLAVGDSLRTDIAGAVGVDLAACWVLDGIHGADLRTSDGSFDTAQAEAAAREAGVLPVATVPRFAW